MAARRINLLPPEMAARRRARQLLTAVAAAGIALVVLLAMVYAIQELRLRGERDRLAEQRAENAALRAEVATLQEFARLEEELRQKSALLVDLTRNEVRWSVLLADVSLVIPSDVWLTNLIGTVTVTQGEQEGAEEVEETLGRIELNGTTFSHPDVAQWLTRLAAVDGFTRPYLSLSARAAIGSTAVVNFNSSVQLTEQAFRRNQRGAQRVV